MNLNLLVQASLFIFLASLPGRTTFLMIIMSAHTRPTKVLAGAGLAFLLQCAISVLIGNLLSFIPPIVLHAAVGLLFIYFAFHFWQVSRDPKNIGTAGAEVTVRSVFSVVFAGEWGDVSQIAIASYSAEHAEKMTVFLASLLALGTTMLIAVCLGRVLRRSLKPHYIQRLAAVGFLITGLYMLVMTFVNPQG